APRAASTAATGAEPSHCDDDGRIASAPRPRSFASCCTPLPRRTRGGEPDPAGRSRSSSASGGCRRLATLRFAKDGLQAGDLPLRLLDFGRIFNPSSHKLKPEVE